jgi:regulatory protein
VNDPTRQRALLLLARRDHSRRELFQKLFSKGFSKAAIQQVLDDLENENLLNEERFIGNFIRFRSTKGYGPLKICAELGKHGIDDSRIYANDEWQVILWHERAISARIKRFGESIPQEKQERIQQARFLQQRGFAMEQIRIALTNSL